MYSLPFTKSRKAPKQDTLARENDSLKANLRALRVERDFWVEQARTLQNHLQTVLRGQASILEQMANYAVDPDSVATAIEETARDLRKPLTSVEAVRALTATLTGAQGKYTAVNSGQDSASLAPNPSALSASHAGTEK